MKTAWLWSARRDKFWRPWEAWVEWDGRVMRSTVDWGWTREAAERKARRRWEKFIAQRDIHGSKRGVPIEGVLL